MSSVPGWRSPFSYLGNSGSTQRSNRQDPGAEGKSHSFELEARIQSAVDYAVANRERFSRHSGAGSDVASSVGSNSPVREMLPLSPLPSMLQSSSNCEFRHLPFRRVGSSPGHLAAQTRPTMQPADEDSAGSIAAGTAAGWSNWGQMIPDGILCPLSLEVMVDPVFTCDGELSRRVFFPKNSEHIQLFHPLDASCNTTILSRRCVHSHTTCRQQASRAYAHSRIRAKNCRSHVRKKQHRKMAGGQLDVTPDKQKALNGVCRPELCPCKGHLHLEDPARWAPTFERDCRPH